MDGIKADFKSESPLKWGKLRRSSTEISGVTNQVHCLSHSTGVSVLASVNQKPIPSVVMVLFKKENKVNKSQRQLKGS